MTEPTPTYNTDPTAPEHQTVNLSATVGDVHVIYMEQRRRALITELRAVEQLLGLPQSIPPKKR